MMGHPVWAEVSAGALTHNLLEVRRLVGRTAVMAVVKANAYGHGMVPAARLLVDGGADWLGVARGTEAVELRRGGLAVPVLVLGYVDPGECRELLEQNVRITAYDAGSAADVAAIARQHNKTLRLHVKVDTGMGRLGFPCDDPGVKVVLGVARLPGVEVEGLFSHFACADEPDKKTTLEQLERFHDFSRKLEMAGLPVRYRHTANSAGLIRFPEAHFDMVRPGLMLYGHFPSPQTCYGPDLRPAMTLKARVVQVKKAPKGFPVSYGWTYKTRGPEVLATVAAGYGDGFNRLLSGAGEVLLGGVRVPVAGRVCMDQIIVQATAVKDVAPGDEAVLFGRQGDAFLPVEELAVRTGTISYEVLCAVSARVARVYVE
ncbi:MAG: alanine racemase [Bacillota bacterium]